MKKRIYLSSPKMSEEGYEKQYVNEAFDTNWLTSVGENIDLFESELLEFVDTENAVALNSGTSAIHMSLKAVGINPSDIVICQSLTFSATVNPIIYAGGKPVFVDSDEESWNMSPEALEGALKKYPNAKAVIIVHIYGLSAKLDEIMEICTRYKVPLIEDAAESLGTFYKEQHTGTFGIYGIFSFNGNKIITTSGGGMLVSKDKERIDKVRFWSMQSKDNEIHYQHSELGYNYRMSNILAGIGRGQLKILKKRVDEKKEIFNYYKKNLGNLEGIEFMPINDWNKPNYWLSCIVLSGKIRPINIIEALESENIEARPIWKPMHLQPFFAKYDYIGGKVSENLFINGVCLPSDCNMSTDDLEYIVMIIRKLWEK